MKKMGLKIIYSNNLNSNTSILLLNHVNLDLSYVIFQLELKSLSVYKK